MLLSDLLKTNWGESQSLWISLTRRICSTQKGQRELRLLSGGGGKDFYHVPQVLNLVADYEKRYGFTRSNMTSWVGNSVTAFLTRAQVERLSQDPLVALLTEDSYGTFSAPPPVPLPWGDVSTSGITRSWGAQATNSKPRSTSNRKVYIIDSGVAQHAALTSVVARKNVACAGAAPIVNPPTAASQAAIAAVAAAVIAGTCDTIVNTTYSNSPLTWPVVGCYSHATHVAGIIGSDTASALGTVGVYPGVKMVSVSTVGAETNYSYGSGSPVPGFGAGWCSDQAAKISVMANALDYVFLDTLNNNGGLVSVTNISMNSFRVGFTASNTPETNYSKLRNLSDPALTKDHRWYQGSFVVQSASNRGVNSCTWDINGYSHSYRLNPLAFPNQTSATDGVMVVGAVSITGQAVSAFQTTNPAGLTALPLPSNYGLCVDVWAPGDRIMSLWGDHTYPNTKVNGYYSGSPNVGTSGWGAISGTSMSAPHIAAAAAWLADTFALTSPAAIEAKIRANLYQFNGATDAAGQPVYVHQLP
jgi:hypothetical protein